MAYINKTRTPFIKVYIKGHYNTSTDFILANKEKIYRETIEVYKGFLTTKKKKLTLYIQAIIVGFEWDIEYHYEKKDFKVLDENILPYFMSIDDYETCAEIIELKKQLQN